MKNESNTPLISVVMCTYNTERFIAEAIDSVLSQTYCDFEFIVWDDGSTDNTRELVKTYKDNRIKYYYHENTGLGMALRLACAEAKGKYIARMDSDDICLPERLSKEVDYLEKHPECVLVSSAVYDIDENGIILGRVFPCSDDKVLKGVLKFPSSMISHPMTMMRRDAYEAAGGYIPIKKSQDMLFWSRLAKQGKFYNISEPHGKYRILSTSLDHAENPYSELIRAFLRKMICDEVVLESDVETFNQLYQYSKQFIKKTGQSATYKTSPEERFFYSIKSIIGSKNAEKLIGKVKFLKRSSVVANIAICSAALAIGLPKLQYFFRSKVSNNTVAPGLAQYYNENGQKA